MLLGFNNLIHCESQKNYKFENALFLKVIESYSTCDYLNEIMYIIEKSAYVSDTATMMHLARCQAPGVLMKNMSS